MEERDDARELHAKPAASYVGRRLIRGISGERFARMS